MVSHDVHFLNPSGGFGGLYKFNPKECAFCWIAALLLLGRALMISSNVNSLFGYENFKKVISSSLHLTFCSRCIFSPPITMISIVILRGLQVFKGEITRK